MGFAKLNLTFIFAKIFKLQKEKLNSKKKDVRI